MAAPYPWSWSKGSGPGLKGFGAAAAARQALYILLALLFDAEEDEARGHTHGADVGCLVGVGAVLGGGIESVAGGRYPSLVHSGHPFFCGPGPEELQLLRGHFH